MASASDLLSEALAELEGFTLAKFSSFVLWHASQDAIRKIEAAQKAYGELEQLCSEALEENRRLKAMDYALEEEVDLRHED